MDEKKYKVSSDFDSKPSEDEKKEATAAGEQQLTKQLTDTEIKLRLRARNQPVCYFGESEEERMERLQHLEKNGAQDSQLEFVENSSGEQQQQQVHPSGKRIGIANRFNLQDEEELRLEEQLQEIESMTPAEQRLFKLRLRMNEARKDNLREVLHEKKQSKSEETSAAGAAHLANKAFFKHKKRIREEEQSLRVTVEDAERIERKQRKKQKRNPEGQEVFESDALFKAYTKRAKSVPNTLEEYEELKERDPDSLYRDVDSLAYGSNGVAVGAGGAASGKVEEKIADKYLDRMATEVHQRIEKRRKFSRRRELRDDEDVTYINKYNRSFNKKLSRSFDKYTAEIKQNLERGTAV